MSFDHSDSIYKEPGISRRSFLRGAAIVAAGASPIGHSLAQGRTVQNVGLQLYTLRNEMAQDFEGTLARVAQLGYREMEFAGYFDKSPAQVRATLDRNGLTSPAAHIQLNAVRENLEAEIESAQIIGQRYIVVPSLPGNERSIADYQRHAETLNRAGEAARSAGIKMGYHNHSFEFEVTDGRIPYDILLEETEASLVDMELDLFWIRNAGVDQTPYFSKYPGRFTMLHVKDMNSAGAMVDVGSGEIDFAEIFSHQATAGFRHFFVEHDNPGDGIASVSRSISTLHNLVY